MVSATNTTARRAPGRPLRSPLAAPAAWSAPDQRAGSARPKTADDLSDRQATIAEFTDYLRTITNRDNRPYQGAIPAGWSKGTGPVRVVPQPDPSRYTLDAEGYVNVAVPSGLTAGSTFTITLSASDGTATQTDTVPVVIKTSCARHY